MDSYKHKDINCINNECIDNIKNLESYTQIIMSPNDTFNIKLLDLIFDKSKNLKKIKDLSHNDILKNIRCFNKNEINVKLNDEINVKLKTIKIYLILMTYSSNPIEFARNIIMIHLKSLKEYSDNKLIFDDNSTCNIETIQKIKELDDLFESKIESIIQRIEDISYIINNILNEK